MIFLGWWGYTGMGMDVDDVKVILEKCLEENKYFKVWNMKWKGDISDMPMDWWKGKVVYYKYKGQVNLKLSVFDHFQPFLINFDSFLMFFDHF